MDDNSETKGSVPGSIDNSKDATSGPVEAQRSAEGGNASNQPTKEEPPKPAGPPMPPGPVDGGLVCWLQIIGSFAMWANSWGMVNTFGVFQTYYEISNLSGKSPSQISWIGSLQAFLLVFVGALSGPLFDAGYFQALNLAGNFLVVFGLMMTSICNEYWQAILAQGLTVGLGCGLLFVPATGIVPQYWVKKRAFASSIAGVGSGFGGLIFPIVFRELQPKIGFGWAVRVIGFLSLFLGIVANVLLRNKTPPGKGRKLLDPEFFKNVPLVFYCVGIFWAFMGLYIPVYYIGTYALEHEITGETLAFYLVAIMQAGSIVGRIGPSFVADKIGPANVLIPAMLANGILALCWVGIKNKAGLIVFAILYGCFFGVVLGLAAPAFMTFMKGDLRKYGTFAGMGFIIAAPGALVGNPISGAILRGSGGFVGVQAFAGCILLASGFFWITGRVLAVGWGVKRI